MAYNRSKYVHMEKLVSDIIFTRSRLACKKAYIGTLAKVEEIQIKFINI